MNIKSLIKVGYIAKTHGLKGEVTAMMDSDIDLADHSVLMIELNGSFVPYSIEAISGQALKPFIKLQSVDTLEAASALKGGSLYISKEERAKLSRGEFYDDEVVDFKAIDANLGELGKVKEVQSHGPNRLILILHGSKEILVPVNGPFIKSINKSKKTIQLELPDGYLEV